MRKFFANSRPSASNFKSFSRSLGQFFLTVGQNNFGNKIPLLLKWNIVKSITVKCKRTYSVCNSVFTITGGKFSSWIVVSQLTPSRVLEQATQPNRSWGSFGNGWISLQTWKIHFTLEQARSSHSHQTITRFEFPKFKLRNGSINQANDKRTRYVPKGPFSYSLSKITKHRTG